MIEYKIPLWTIISFALLQLVSFAWFLIQLYFTAKEHKERIREIEAENLELKKDLKNVLEKMQDLKLEISVIKNNVEHIMVGLLKDGRRSARPTHHGEL